MVKTNNPGHPISILIAGDLYPGGNAEKSILSTNKLPIDTALQSILQQHDICVANLECPLTQNYKTKINKDGPHLSAHPSCAEAIKNSGFQILSLANNHILDMDIKGISDTFHAINKAGLQFVGAGINRQEALKPLFIDRKGLKICFIAITENEFSIAGETTPGACPLNPVQNYFQIIKAKNEADLIIILLHAGNEYYHLPRPGLKQLCHYFIHIGADAIICSHAHCASGIEYYCDSPIIYGTGNFIFNNPKNNSADWNTGQLVSLTLMNESIKAELLPYRKDRQTHIVRKMNKQEEKRFLSKIDRASNIISDDHELANEWQRFCRSKRIEYLSKTMLLNYYEESLFKRGVWPFWHTRKKRKKPRFTRLINLVQCESHQEALIEILNQEIKNSDYDNNFLINI